ncbi:MAG: hypothetical protein N3G21_08450 [Candidatus Hydrogenedentes bacterium]|nr:hypothetical protein [Candidatus Hydrogenedentota bacterium]
MQNRCRERLLIFCLQIMISFPIIAQVEEMAIENTIDNYLKTAKAIYLINTVQDLLSISQNIYTLSRQYKLAADLDLSETQSWNNGKGFKPIGSTSMPFKGSFDGDGHKITGLYINRPEENNVGLFGVIAPGAEIKNLALENANVTGKQNTGIIAGLNGGSINKSGAVGVVLGTNAVGTFVGMNTGSISDTFAMGFVKGDIWIGGLVGRNEGGDIKKTYFTGKILGNLYFGGLVGTNNSGSVSYSYWDTQISGMPLSSGGLGKNTSEMFNKLTYQNWNFDSVWAIRNGLNYPYLRVLGEYTYPEPQTIEIVSIEELSKIGKEEDFPWYGTYALGNDIMPSEENSKSGLTLDPIPSFNGTFDGNGFSIVGLKINKPQDDYIGLFSHLFYGGKIQNLILENCEITGHYIVGGLIALNEGGTIEKCKVNGIIVGKYKTGGIVGWNYKGSIYQCFSEGSLKTKEEGGGIVGSNFYYISNCYSYMGVEGLFMLGGFSGYNSGTISYSYSTGKVIGNGDKIGGFNGFQEKGKFISCYWDRETSGVTTSSGGLGRTTNQMKDKDTYYEWDFTNIWYIKSGETYPLLRWTGTFEGEGEPLEGTIEGEGILEGVIEGEGASEGILEGSPEGQQEGVQEGVSEGTPSEGQPDGVKEGIQEGQPEGSPTEGVVEGEGEGGSQPPETKCGCFDRNKENSDFKFILDFIFIGIVIILGTAIRNKKNT